MHKLHPDYVLAIDHVTAYYDMKLATFGVDEDNDMLLPSQYLSKTILVNQRHCMKLKL